MDVCQAVPEWVVYALAAYPVLNHLRTLAPPQYRGAIGVGLAVADKLLGNYASCKNRPAIDQQDRITPRPK